MLLNIANKVRNVLSENRDSTIVSSSKKKNKKKNNKNN